ncbi:MAG: hypothetical protein WCA51_03370 [Dehalococcoidia bacterium]
MVKKCPVTSNKCWGSECLWWDSNVETCYIVLIGTQKSSATRRKKTDEIEENIKIITGIPRPGHIGEQTITIPGRKREKATDSGAKGY